ncbi:hypothetical protein KBD71_05005 [Candidatus Woesebacteria bacterium]|nr:hypothetical protein [Candidatus Woesebacteria bacterium]
MAAVDEYMRRVHEVADSSLVIGRGNVPTHVVIDTDINPPPDLTEEAGTNVTELKERRSTFLRWLNSLLQRR